MVPEGLMSIVTLVYAWATSNMARLNAIIRRLPTVEILGSVTVICSDKTGTLTKNMMSLTEFVTSDATYKVDSRERADPIFSLTSHCKKVEELMGDTYSTPSQDYIMKALACGILCSKCVLGKDGSNEGSIGNPTELAIVRAAYFAGVNVEELKSNCPIIAELPFSSQYKFMATVHEPFASIDGSGQIDEYTVYVKGAPDVLAELCSHQAKAGMLDQIEPFDKSYWTSQVASLSSGGLRVLALCRASVSKSKINPCVNLSPEFVNEQGQAWLTMIGLCGIIDPPRPECIEAISEAHMAGVRVAMITGDHKDTALAIGRMLNLVNENFPEAITGPELEVMSEEEVNEAVMRHNIFARASPQNKIHIVKALQARGHVCAMTGDGVNDAPALKAADMGVAMGKEGTDVAREAGDLILADDNFATIVSAIKEGRVVWENLRKVLLINTVINNSQGLTVLFGLLVGLPFSPLNPIQVLYSNLITAVTLGFVCAIEPAEEGIMKQPPRRVGKFIIGRFLLLRIIFGTIVLTFSTIASVFWLASFGEKYASQEQQTALAFNVLDSGAVSVALSSRVFQKSSLSLSLGNKWNVIALTIFVMLQLAVTYIPGLNTVVFKMAPMDGLQWGITLFFMAVVFLLMEMEKFVRLRSSKTRVGISRDDDKEDWIFDEPVQKDLWNDREDFPSK